MGVLVNQDGKLVYKTILTKEKLINELVYNKIAKEKCDMKMPNICFSKKEGEVYEVIYIYNVPPKSICMELTDLRFVDAITKYYRKKSSDYKFDQNHKEPEEIKSLEELDDLTYKLYSSRNRNIVFDSKRKISKDAAKIIALDFLLNQGNRSSNSIDVCSSEEKTFKVIGSRENTNLFSTSRGMGISKSQNNFQQFIGSLQDAYFKNSDRTYFEDFKKYYLDYYQNITPSYFEETLLDINSGYKFNEKNLCFDYSTKYVKIRENQMENVRLLK